MILYLKILLLFYCRSSFFLHDGIGNDLQNLHVNSLRWLNQEDVDSLLIVSANYSGGSFVETWCLTEESVPIHKNFQSKKQENFKKYVRLKCLDQKDNFHKLFSVSLKEWISQQHYKNNSNIVRLVTTKNTFGTNSYIFAAYQDNVIHCLCRDNLKRVVTSVCGQSSCFNAFL